MRTRHLTVHVGRMTIFIRDVKATRKVPRLKANIGDLAANGHIEPFPPNYPEPVQQTIADSKFGRFTRDDKLDNWMEALVLCLVEK